MAHHSFGAFSYFLFCRRVLLKWRVLTATLGVAEVVFEVVIKLDAAHGQ